MEKVVRWGRLRKAVVSAVTGGRSARVGWTVGAGGDTASEVTGEPAGCESVETTRVGVDNESSVSRNAMWAAD